MLPAIIIEVKDILLKIVIDKKKIIGIALILIINLVVTLTTTHMLIIDIN